jgi:hypothetical protein
MSAKIIDSASLPALQGKAFNEARDNASESDTASVTTSGRTDKSRRKKKRRQARRREAGERAAYAASETDEDEGTVGSTETTLLFCPAVSRAFDVADIRWTSMSKSSTLHNLW